MMENSTPESAGEKAILAAPPSRDAPSTLAPSKEEEKTVEVNVQPEREANFKDFLRIFSYAKKKDWILMAIGIIASLGGGITMPVMNVVFGRLTGTFTAYFTPGAAFPQATFEKLVNRQALNIFGLFVARFGAGYLNKFCFRMIGIRMSAAIRLHYLESLFKQSVHVLDSMPSGQAAGTITATANTLQLGISEKLGTFFEFNATIIASIIIAFVYSWELTLVTSSAILFIVLALCILLPFIIRGHARVTKAEAKASSIATEAFSGIRMVASCGAESRIAQKYSEWVERARYHGQRTSPLVATQFGVIFFSVYGMFALSFWYGTKCFVEGRIGGIQEIIIVLMSVMMLVMSLERTSTPLIAASKSMVAAAEFFAVIDAPKPEVGKLTEPDVTAGEDIIFRDVHFAYPSRPSNKVLDGLNLRIEANKNTAIVGPSGSGKSTITGLIVGWYTLHDQHTIARTIAKDKAKDKKKKKKGKGDDDGDEEGERLPSLEDTGPRVQLSGTVSTCGHRFDEINIKWWRTQIGLVAQESFLFNETIFKNVAAGLIGTEWESAPEAEQRELVKTACVESFADEFIDRLPDGYDTQVGDSGLKLSGGQRQRIAIARSIVKKPKILILDEATSAIDVRGERIVQAALERASKGRTTITIAHRLSTIKDADKIVVLKNGRVAEQGTHESLLSNEDGVYHGLVNAQKLSLGDGAKDDDSLHEEDIGVVLEREKSAANSEAAQEKQGPVWRDRNVLNGFGKLLGEQKSKIPLYIIAVFGAIGAAAAVPLQAYLFSKIITVFQEFGQKFLDDAVFWSKMWAVLAAFVGVSYFSTAIAATNCEHSIAAIYQQQYFESLLFQKISYFDQEDNATGQLTARLMGDSSTLKELMGVNMMMVLVGMFTLVGALAISFAYGWKLALVALCVTIPLGVVSGFLRVRYEMQFNAMAESVFQESSKFGAESIGAFRTVSALTMEDTIIKRYRELLDDHVVTAYKKARWTTIIFALSDSVSLGCQALIFWYGGQLLATREYNSTAFFVTYMAGIQGAESAGTWLSFGPNAAQASAAANRILSIRDTKNLDAIPATEQIPDTGGGVKIELEDVYFKYPTRDMSVFKGLNITIEKSQFAALVGASGSGKSSIISLLERFYDLNRGRILFNGKDITEINLYEFRKNISLVSQEPMLFQGSLRDNILLGVDPASVTDEELHRVCQAAAIHDFIVSLPEGYNTNIGNRGVSLSGGQKQRISIARALIRNPRVLLLDEATSSLDSESEKLVQAAFERVAKGRTTIAVAHRLATIQNADIIYVLGEGKVLEKGNHSELLKRRGVYYHMCHNQALDR